MVRNEPFLTTDQVLDYLQVNLRTVYRLIKAGQIPAVRVGRQWRFRKSDIDAWLGTQAVSRPPVAEDHTATFTATGRPKVLVVDDEPSIRDLLVRALALADYEVDVAANGHDALDRVREHGCHLLITDIEMPEMNGLTLISEARRLTPRLPAIVMTGCSTEVTAIEAANIGVSGYFTKPFKIPKVLAATARVLGE